MKTMKLNDLARNALNEREMNSVSGGNECGCACKYNTTMDNGNANYAHNWDSVDCELTEMDYVLDGVVITP